VGEAHDRFVEDGLRILRAVRIATDIGFTIDKKTEKAILDNALLLKNISKERIRDEFSKIIMSAEPMRGLTLCNKFGLLPYIIPELEKTISIEQGRSHIYDVWEHSLRSLQHSAEKAMPLEVRLATLFHDIGKPETRRWSKEENLFTFYGHEVAGARITEEILTRLKFPTKVIEKTVKLVRWHMFFADTEQISLSAVRRIIAQVGKDSIWDLMNVRFCDRIGMGRPKEDPYRLRKYHAMVEEALRDPISVGMLKIDGNQVIEALEDGPGPKVGFILNALLEEVLEDPKLNTEEYLKDKAKELSKLTIAELKKLGESGKEKLKEEEGKELKKIHMKHKVK
jgi:putative nucleotidyltransferase with HDIG domain